MNWKSIQIAASLIGALLLLILAIWSGHKPYIRVIWSMGVVINLGLAGFQLYEARQSRFELK